MVGGIQIGIVARRGTGMVTRNGAECPFMGALGSPSEHGLTGTEQSLKDQPSKASLTTIKQNGVGFPGSLSWAALATCV